MWSDMKLQKPVPIHRQVEAFVRQLIHSGELAEGAKLPSTQELARSCGGNNVRAVHVALSLLVKEGLLKRHPGVGTFVCRREAKLTHVAVHSCEDQDVTAYNPFYGAVRSELKNLLHEKGIELEVLIDARPESRQHEPLQALVRAAQERRVQAVIVPLTNLRQLSWLQKLPVPVASLSTSNLPNEVQMDGKQLVRLSLEALARQGCRSLGVITSIAPEALEQDGKAHPNFELFKEMVIVARERGLEIRNEWMHTTHAENEYVQPADRVAYGYREFRQLWSLPQRPEGLLAFPDTIAQGVVHGLLEQQVRVPQDLKLVFHKNQRVPLLCPMPATFIVTDERQIAQALLTQIEKQFSGQPVETIVLPYAVEENPVQR